MPAVDVSLSDRIKQLQELADQQRVDLTLTYETDEARWVGWIGEEEDPLEGETLEDLVDALESELEN